MNSYLHRMRSRTGRTSRLNSSPYRVPVEYKDNDKWNGLIKTDLLVSSRVENSCGVGFCVVCQDDIYLDIVRKLKCSHVYHIKCIDTWFTNNSICPTCKLEF